LKPRIGADWIVEWIHRKISHIRGAFLITSLEILQSSFFVAEPQVGGGDKWSRYILLLGALLQIFQVATVCFLG
jgi:hypothetical protein